MENASNARYDFATIKYVSSIKMQMEIINLRVKSLDIGYTSVTPSE